MRIGTWNLEGRWDARHLALIETMDCDVLPLTEVSERVEIPGYDLHLGRQVMSPKRRWAAVASRLPMRPAPDPQWRLSDGRGGWPPRLLHDPPVALVWHPGPMGGRHHRGEDHRRRRRGGGRRPHGLGRRLEPRTVRQEWTGSVAGRRSVLESFERLGLQVPTAVSPHQIEDLLSIDHIAVPKSWTISATQRHRAFVGESRISDHDAYVVEAASASTDD